MQDMTIRSPFDADAMDAPTGLSRVASLSSRDRMWHQAGARLREAAVENSGPRVHSGVPEDELRRLFRDSTVPDAPEDFADYARFLAETVVPHSINMDSTRCFGHMTGTPPEFVHCVAGLVSRLNQNLVRTDASRVLSLLERQTMAALHRMAYERGPAFYDAHIQHPESTLGVVCSGATVANLTALWCARNASLGGVDDEGLVAALRGRGARGAVILGSERMHYSIDKSAAVLGLGAAGVIKVGVDADQRVDLRALEREIERCRRRRLRIVALVGVAGSTDCGSIDPLGELAEIARRERLHFHVDAAAGFSLLFSQRHSGLLQGIGAADSIALDAHKQLCLPIGAGVMLLRDPRAARWIEKRAAYILQAGSADLGRFTLEGSRVGAALAMHASLRVIGRRGFATLVERNLANATDLAALIAGSCEFELLQRPQLNIVLYRYVPERLRAAHARRCLTADEQQEINAVNRELQRRQYDEGRSLVSRTTLDSLAGYRGAPIVALRAVLSNPSVCEFDMSSMVGDQRRIAASMS